jgi:ketosteroid isomerase-like protein
MRKAFFMLFAVLLLWGCGGKEAVFREAEIRKVLENQEEAWNRGDIYAFMDGYDRSDSTRFISKRGITYGWKQVLQNYKKSYPDVAAMGLLHFTLYHIESPDGLSASVTGKWTLSDAAEETSGHFLLLLKNTEKGWKITVDCTS